MKLDYSQIEEPQIQEVVRAFRLSPYYGKRVAKLKRRSALRAGREQESQNGRWLIEVIQRSYRKQHRLESLVQALRLIKRHVKAGASMVTIRDTLNKVEQPF